MEIDFSDSVEEVRERADSRSPAGLERLSTVNRVKLETAFPRLVRVANLLYASLLQDAGSPTDPARQERIRSRAWLIAGAIDAYTGNQGISTRIIAATGATQHDYPKVVGQINDALRGKVVYSRQLQNVLELLSHIERLPDHPRGTQDPTRMMDSYPDIDKHYQVGNVLLMAEVGSVCRNRPAPGMYAKQYRIHMVGGLKDITDLNPAQQELVYAPGTPYEVTRRWVGKKKAKKGNQSHIHIELTYAPNKRGRATDLSSTIMPSDSSASSLLD